MNRYQKVISILDGAVGGPAAPVGFHGPFWRNRTRDAFVAHVQFGQQLIVLNDPASSALIRALKGDAPFDGAPFGRMPSGGNPPVPADQIAFIEQWISDGCPEDELPEEGIQVDVAAGAPASDEFCTTYWREFDRWSLFDRTPEVDAAIGRFLFGGVVQHWMEWAAARASEANWTAAIEEPDTRAAITLLATRQAETVTGHFGNPVPLLTLLDCYDRFGSDRLPPDPLRPTEPRHNMNGASMWFIWSAFADACLRLQIEPVFWRGHLRAILLGMLNDGVFRGRFAVSGFAATDAGRAAMSDHVQALPDGDLVAESVRRFRESGLAGPLGDGTPAVVRRYRIHPAIGIARLGNSPQAFFIGPESPGRSPLPEGESYRDDAGNIKRQAVRYRIYESSFDSEGRLLGAREVTAADAEIRWTVHMVNRKAAAATFPPLGGRRNEGETDRSRLVIDSGAQTVSGRNERVVMSGAFRGQPITLGEIRTDDAGRLVVLGGFGVSGFVAPGTPQIENFANNDGWHDDVADGPVRATIRLEGGELAEADPAWVIVAPPSYAPEIHNVVTMYDQALNAAVELDPTLAASLEPVSFTGDIYRILERTVLMQWVSSDARFGHGPGTAGDLLEPARLQRLADNGPGSLAERMLVFNILIPPGTPAGGRGAAQRMPRLEDGLDPEDPSRTVEMTLTPLQYRQMEKWGRGLFSADWPGAAPVPPALEDIPPAEQPAALDRAATDACIGGPFYPGIESGIILARLDTYRAPFRVKTTFEPGAFTAGNACPWQADFLACSQLWWPAQRPNEVLRTAGGVPTEWTPNGWGYADMLEDWAKLGFVLKDGENYLEKDRLIPDPAVPVG